MSSFKLTPNLGARDLVQLTAAPKVWISWKLKLRTESKLKHLETRCRHPNCYVFPQHFLVLRGREGKLHTPLCWSTPKCLAR